MQPSAQSGNIFGQQPPVQQQPSSANIFDAPVQQQPAPAKQLSAAEIARRKLEERRRKRPTAGRELEDMPDYVQEEVVRIYFGIYIRQVHTAFHAWHAEAKEQKQLLLE